MYGDAHGTLSAAPEPAAVFRPARRVAGTLTPTGWELRARARAAQARVEDATGLAPRELGALRDELQALTERLRAVELRPGAAS